MPMAFGNAQKLQSLGVPTQLAVELQAQITANVGNARRLQELGFVPKLAEYVATSITTGPMVATKAVEYGLDAVVSKSLTAMVNA